ncbi:class I SAM-dependent methyltransferase [Candidatus Fermentibacteria bacterium]|nr:class I SAM-dependent methyltransferase [Candidatus Fermentibacteria bacterium]
MRWDLSVSLAESGRVPDVLVRRGMHRLIAATLQHYRAEITDRDAWMGSLVRGLKASPIALTPDEANRQHYELPPEFFSLVLGKAMKYSCCLWEPGTTSLDEAEEAMLTLTAQRAGLADGMRILDAGCGWGSMALWAAARYPGSSITALTNSRLQRDFVVSQAQRRGIPNIRAVLDDIGSFVPDRRFDRIVSVEMFEHVRNFAELLRRMASWLVDRGALFVHHFCHRDIAYVMDASDERDWMARHFFTGGMMPSADLLLHFQDDLTIASTWRIDGTHYARTLGAWLSRMDAHAAEVRAVFAAHYGHKDARLWYNRWRMFFMGCEELFGYREGREWQVVHHLFTRT